jgi:hypothetical protein
MLCTQTGACQIQNLTVWEANLRKFHISNMVSGKIAGAGKGLNKPESPLKAQTQFVALSSGTERFKGSSWK